MHAIAARHMSKVVRDTLPGSCRGESYIKLSAFCFATLLDLAPCTVNNEHKGRAAKRGQNHDGRMAEGGALGAKHLNEMLHHTPFHVVLLCRMDGPVISHLRWTHAHVRCAAKSQITQANTHPRRSNEAFSHFCS